MLGIYDYWHVKNKKYYKQFNIGIDSASKKFLMDVQNMSYGYGNIYTKNKKNFVWKVRKKSEVKILIDFMYKHEGFSLTRKRKKCTIAKELIG